MTSNIVVIVAFLAAAAAIFLSRLRKSRTWQATVTPLASIIGSGFLVSVPLLAAEVGNLALVAMAGLILVAYIVGAAIRFNIRHLEPLLADSKGADDLPLTRSLESLSHFVLAIAYFISVAYYLVLLGNFLLSGIGTSNLVLANAIATTILVALGILGYARGLGVVERVETYTVGINLAVIVALLGGLVWYNGAEWVAGTWHAGPAPETFGLHSLQVILGLLIVVQGFETSRFLGEEYDADTRIRTMRYAQWISAAIYIAFFLLMMDLTEYLGEDTDVTAIISVVGHVALVLPAMLAIGAVASQFSASVADSVGCAGLLEDIHHWRPNLQHTYPLIALIAIAIIWSANVFEIVTLASRAFALYYLLQSVIALTMVGKVSGLQRRRLHATTYAVGALLCLCIVLFGTPSSA